MALATENKADLKSAIAVAPGLEARPEEALGQDVQEVRDLLTRGRPRGPESGFKGFVGWVRLQNYGFRVSVWLRVLRSPHTHGARTECAWCGVGHAAAAAVRG